MATPSQEKKLQLPRISGGGLTYYNRKTESWEPNPNHMPDKRQKDNGIWGVVGRGYYYKCRQGNIFCTSCDHTFSPQRYPTWTQRYNHVAQACGNCGSRAIVPLSPEVRVPRQSANTRVWRNFKAMFIDHLIASAKKTNTKWPEPQYTDTELEAQWAVRDAYDKQQQALLEAEEITNKSNA